MKEHKSIAQTLGGFIGNLIALLLGLTGLGCIIALSAFIVKEFWLLLN